MKKLIAAILIIGATCSSGFAKPGGWIKDFFLNNHSHCYNQVYYEQPVYYYQQPRVVVYERPVYYQQPRHVHMQPYQNYYYEKPTPIYPNRW